MVRQRKKVGNGDPDKHTYRKSNHEQYYNSASAAQKDLWQKQIEKHVEHHHIDRCHSKGQYQSIEISKLIGKNITLK